MSSLLPPVFRGKIATTPGHLLAAAAAMFVLDLIVFHGEGPGIFVLNFGQIALLIAVLLLSPRRWVALLLLLPASLFFLPYTPSAETGQRLVDIARALAPLLLGVFIGYPRSRKRRVYAEDEEEKTL